MSLAVETQSVRRLLPHPVAGRGRLRVGTVVSLGLHGLLCLGLINAAAFPVKRAADTVTADTMAVDILGVVEEAPPQEETAEVPSPPPLVADPPPMLDSPPPPSVPPSPAPKRPPPPARPKTESKLHPAHHRPMVSARPAPDVEPSPGRVSAPVAPVAPVALVAPAVRQLPPAGVETVRDYGRALWARIARHKPAGVMFRGSTVVTFALSSEGDLISVVVSRSSGNASLDRASVGAVQASAPFPPPPPGFSPGDLVFSLSFDYH